MTAYNGAKLVGLASHGKVEDWASRCKIEVESFFSRQPQIAVNLAPQRIVLSE